MIDTFRKDPLEDEGTGQDKHSSSFNLDSPIDEEGGNLSIGQVRDSDRLSKQSLIASSIAIPGVTRPCTRQEFKNFDLR